jgi:AAA family ATP:ADP antiporter
MSRWPDRLTRLDKLLGAFTKLRPAEGRSVVVFFTFALLIMMSYYILKTIREPLLLTDATAETKSYAYAATALLLLFIIPVYGLVFRHTGKRQLTRFVTGFFLANLLIFFLMGRAGMDIGFAYYVWVGIFSVMITAQFWAFAADTFNVKSGQRLFPLIMVGATLGSLVAPALSGALFPVLGPWVLMLIAMILLALTIPCVGWSRALVPPGSRSHYGEHEKDENGGIFGGLSLVFTDRYLFLLALLIMLLNWVNTTGEYILTELVVRQAEALVASQGGVDKGEYIAAFYGNFYSVVNTLTLLIQIFLVSRIIHWIGIRGAVLVLPVIAIVGYGLVVFIPVFSIIRIIKLLENSTDYSLMNTVRHALYLPLTAVKKYEGKTTIEAFFWRFGDLAQAGGVYIGLNWLNFEVKHFAMLNMVLALAWLFVAWQIGKLFGHQEANKSANMPPRLVHAIEDRYAPPGTAFSFELPGDTFVDPDEGDVLTVSAHLAGQHGLPDWMKFDPDSLAFSGRPPANVGVVTELILRATDFDGAWAEGHLLLHHQLQEPGQA